MEKRRVSIKYRDLLDLLQNIHGDLILNDLKGYEVVVIDDAEGRVIGRLSLDEDAE